MQVKDPVDEAGGLRNDELLVKELPQVAVGLKYARTLGALDALLPLDDHALEERSEQENGQDLSDLQQDIAGHSQPALRERAAENRPRYRLSDVGARSETPNRRVCALAARSTGARLESSSGLRTTNPLAKR